MGLQNVPMQSGSNFDRVTQVQQLLQGLNARELQQVFQNTQRLVDGNHQRFVPDRLGDVPPEFGGGFIFFFRLTPLGFRQVVQHVRLHVA